MQDRLTYEYSILRIVPKVERGELINVGVIMMCKSKGFIQVKYELDSTRLLALAPYLDIQMVHEYLKLFEIIAYNCQDAGLIGGLPIHERFRWLTAKRSTIIQASPVHGGITCDLKKTFQELYQEYVSLPLE